MDASKFLKNIIKYCIPSIVSAVVGIAVIPLISRVFPTDDYGKINLFYSVGNMMLYIVLLGLDSAYIRFYFEQPKGSTRRQLFSLSVWTSTILLGVITVIVIMAFPYLVSDYLFGEMNRNGIVALFVYIIGLVLFRLLSIETRMEDRALRYNIQQILLIFTNRVSFVLIALYSTNYQYSIWAITISSIVLGLFFFLTQKRISDLSFPNLAVNTMKTIFLFSIPLMPTTVMTWLNNSAAKMVLSGFNDFDSVGVLSIATSVANIFSLVPAAFATYWSPFMYKNYKTQNEFIKSVHNYICILILFLVVGIFCFQDVLYFIVGDSYKASQAYFMLVMLTPIQTLLCETTCYGIILSNNTKYNLYISVVAVAFNIAFGITFYKWIGVYSVIIGIVGSALIQIILKTMIGQKFYKSINNPIPTIVTMCLVLITITLNVFLYNSLTTRVFISILILLVTCFLYKTQVLSIYRFIKRQQKRA